MKIPETKTTIYHGPDSDSFRLKSGDVVDGIHFKQVGSVTGRFLFTDWAPMAFIPANSKDIEILNCWFEGQTIN